jgi:hypothetical protein
MDERESRVEARLRDIDEALRDLARRVARLEGAPHPSENPAPARHLTAAHDTPRPPVAAIAAVATAATPDYVNLLSLVGRTCVVLGGAYLLRALTESGRLPAPHGVTLGLVYAVAWFGAADHAGMRRPVSGLFHGVAGVLIGLPLLWEASTRFHLLFPWSSALALAALTSLALGVAWHRHLQSLAGVAAIGAVGTALVLAVATAHLVPYVFLLALLGVAIWWMSDACHWPWLRWPAALAADLMVVALALRAVAEPPLDSPAVALFAGLLLVALFLATVAVRALVSGRPVRPFDSVQTLLVLVCGLGAAFACAPLVGAHVPAWIAAGLVAAAVAAYGTAARLARRAETGRNFYYYATLGLVLVMTGLGTLVAGAARDLAFTALALGAAWWGTRALHPALGAHSAALTVAAAKTSGLLGSAVLLWLSPLDHWPAFPPTGWVVLGAAIAGVLIPRHAPVRALEIVASMSRLMLALVLVVGFGSLLLLVLGPWVSGTPPDAGWLASLKTVILAGAAVALALIARLPDGGELGWLAYPVLLVGGVKLVAEDFRLSQPSTLFVALAAYGAALILTARIARQRHPGQPTH